MDYQTAKTARATLETELKVASDALKNVPGIGSGAFGITPDHIRATDTWQRAKSEYDRAFKALQQFNIYFTKQFAKEYRADRR